MQLGEGIMNFVRRSGAPTTFAVLLVVGASCAALSVACGSNPTDAPLGYPGSPTGGGPAASGDDASTASPSGQPGPSGDDGSAPSRGDAAAADADAGPPVQLPGPTGDPSTTFTLLDTTVTTVVNGQAVAGWDPIPEGATLDLSKLGTQLSIRANVAQTPVGSVAFVLDGKYDHTENAVPYTLCGDNGQGTITSCSTVLTPGKHALSVTPYSGPSESGQTGNWTILYFTVTDGGDGGAGDAGDAGDAATD